MAGQPVAAVEERDVDQVRGGFCGLWTDARDDEQAPVGLVAREPAGDVSSTGPRLAPADSRSGTPVDSSHSSRAGNKTLKNLLIFSCNSLVGTKNRFGRYYDECASRGMRRNRALKAVARKSLGVIYAVMRDRVPYEEPPSGASTEKPPAAA